MLHLLHPLYLFGLFLATIPFILHLLGRRRIREKLFSSLFLLKEIKKSSSVWMRIKDLILLLLRVSFLLFIVIGFTHPLILSPFSFLGKKPPKDVALLIDVSMSMGVKGVLAQEKAEAKKIYRTLGHGNRVLAITFSDRIEEEKEIADESELNAFLNRLKVTYRGTDLVPALEEAEKKLLKKEGFIKELFIISDFQKKGLKNIQPLYTRLCKEKINIHTSLIETSKENKFFTGYKIEPPFPLSGLRVKFFPDLVSTEKGSNSIEFYMGGIMKGVKNRTEGKNDIFFETETGRTGYKSGYFSISGDSLNMDNNYYFSFYVPENLNVLLIGKGNEYSYLSTALNPGIKTVIKLEIIDPVKLPRIDLNQYDLLILYNTKMDGIVEAKTMGYLEKGGGVLFIMGDEFKKEVGKDIFKDIHIVKKMETKKGFFTIKTVDTGFEPLSGFKNKGLKNLYDTKFFQYFQLQSKMKPVIKGNNGDALLFSGNIDGGKVILFPFVINPEWTQLPLKAIFVPLIYRLTFYLARKQEKLPEFSVGDPIKISFPKEAKQALFITPDNRKKSPVVSMRMDEVDYILKDTDIPGIYRFIPQPSETIPVAVNVKEDESRLDAFSFEELKNLFPDIRKVEEVKTFTSSDKRWLDLFPFLIVLSLMCLIAELILEN